MTVTITTISLTITDICLGISVIQEQIYPLRQYRLEVEMMPITIEHYVIFKTYLSTPLKALLERDQSHNHLDDLRIF